MEWSSEKSKVMSSSTADIKANIGLNTHKVYDVGYLGSTFTKDKLTELRIRFEKAYITKFSRIWESISFLAKLKLFKSLFTSILL